MDFASLDNLPRTHPAWRLVCAQHAPLIASCLPRVFIVHNLRAIAQADLVEALEDELFSLRELYGESAYPHTALEYLNDWAESDKGWLRKFYPQGTDEPHFDLTPATEKAISWLESLSERSFVGTESRLLTLFEILRQMSEGSEVDPKVRLAELERRRREIDEKMEQVRQGRAEMLDDTALKDRFQQFQQLARELLTDFREVEQNFRLLDRHVRERIARGGESKGTLLDVIMGERDAISDSDQGRSFRAFWDFLMSHTRQEEFGRLLRAAFDLPAVQSMKPERRLLHVHYDWLEAGEHTQRTVARLSQQLRRFLDDQAWLENRRIMSILQSIETQALDVRDDPPKGPFMEMDDACVTLELPMERPLYHPARPVPLADLSIVDGEADVDTTALYTQVVVDRAELERNILQELRTSPQTTLARVAARHPLRHGLAEILVYLKIADTWPHAAVDEETSEEVSWEPEEGVVRKAILPRVIFARR